MAKVPVQVWLIAGTLVAAMTVAWLDAGDPKCLENQDAVDVLRSEGLLK